MGLLSKVNWTMVSFVMSMGGGVAVQPKSTRAWVKVLRVKGCGVMDFSNIWIEEEEEGEVVLNV